MADLEDKKGSSNSFLAIEEELDKLSNDDLLKLKEEVQSFLVQNFSDKEKIKSLKTIRDNFLKPLYSIIKDSDNVEIIGKGESIYQEILPLLDQCGLSITHQEAIQRTQGSDSKDELIRGIKFLTLMVGERVEEIEEMSFEDLSEETDNLVNELKENCEYPKIEDTRENNKETLHQKTYKKVKSFLQEKLEERIPSKYDFFEISRPESDLENKADVLTGKDKKFVKTLFQFFYKLADQGFLSEDESKTKKDEIFKSLYDNFNSENNFIKTIDFQDLKSFAENNAQDLLIGLKLFLEGHNEEVPYSLEDLGIHALDANEKKSLSNTKDSSNATKVFDFREVSLHRKDETSLRNTYVQNYSRRSDQITRR